MGYIYISCHTCGREIKHHSRDVVSWPTRICPGCGTSIRVTVPEEPKKSDD